jgi:hypothetical protein
MIKRIVGAGVAALTIAAGSVALTASPAVAAGTDGKVISRTNLRIHNAPSVHAAGVGSYKPGKTIPLTCKTTGTTVDGNNIWYEVPIAGDGPPHWVAARYVQNIGKAPGWCGNDERFVGKATASLTKRAAPNTADARVGSYAKGAGVDIICKATAQSIGGNKFWYWTSSHRWVSARYVDNVGSAPNWCL